MCVSLSGTVALVCFFAPKVVVLLYQTIVSPFQVYIVLFQPYKNVRTRQSAVGRLVNQQMRFMRYERVACTRKGLRISHFCPPG